MGRGNQDEFIRGNISDVKDRLFKRFILLNNFVLGNGIIDSEFEFYRLIFLRILFTLTIIVIAHS